MKSSPRMEFFLIFFCFINFFLQPCFAASQPPIPVGRVVWIKGGTLKAVMENKEERTLQAKSIIYLHDTLVTDTGTKAEIGFTDQTLMTLAESTTFKVDKYQHNTDAKRSGGKSAMSLVEGGFRTITGAIAKNTPNNYEVNTPVATIGVRGTEYRTFTRGDTTYMGWYSGTPCIRVKKETCDDYKRKFPDKYKKEQEQLTDQQKKLEKVLCLSKERRWAKVVGPCGNPEPLAQAPDEFNDDIEITDAYIEPFETVYKQRPGGGGGGGRSNDFCIQ